jgi:hypothetical protein
VTALVLAGVVLVACGGEPDVASETGQAGPAMPNVGAGDAVWTEVTEWRVAAEPTLTIGRENAARELRFNTIRSMFRLSDGALAVVNAGSPREIRIFDSGGALLVRFGGDGEGPGEFRTLWGAWLLPGDSILAFDTRLGRTTLFDRQGRPHRTEGVGRLPEGGFVVLDRFDDGSWLLAANVPETLEQNGITQVRRYLARSWIGSETTDTLIRFGEAIKVRERLELETPLFYPGVGTYIAHGNRLYAGYPNDFTIDVLASDGTPVHRIARPVERRAATSDVVDVLLESMINAAPAARRASFEENIRRREPPETLPAFGSPFVVDVLNNLWVPDFIVPGDDPVQWSVFDEAGTYLGRIGVPARLRPMEIGIDYILGVWRDELDVETVRMYALDRRIAS